MIKRAFTLVEILVSIVLLSLIVVFVSSTIVQTKTNNVFFKEQVNKDEKSFIIFKILYKDLYELIDGYSFGNKKYSMLSLKTNNTLYGINQPYVVWIVQRDENTLLRLESAKPITLPLKEEKKKYIFIDRVFKGCKSFIVSFSKDKNSILVFLDLEGSKKNLLFEVKLLR